MHWCADETFMVLSMIPFLSYPIYRLKIWWYKRFHKNCSHNHDHSDHS